MGLGRARHQLPHLHLSRLWLYLLQGKHPEFVGAFECLRNFLDLSVYITLLFYLALFGYGLHSFLDLLRITEIVVFYGF